MVVVPAFPVHAIDRPLLRQQLDDVLSRPLGLVTAPAGSGKSVLLAQWISSHPELDVVMLTLDSSDDDPVRFCGRLLDGLGAIDPSFGDLSPLVAMHGGGLGTPLIEAVVDQLLTFDRTVIILDDVHRLGNAVLISDLGRLVDALPPTAHIILSSRADIAFPWGHHRLTRGVTEIRQLDLAFDHGDGAELLERIANRSLSHDSVTALLTRTEGWAAGLQLAGITLRNHNDPVEFVAEFSGNDRLIADYLGEEVLESQPANRRRLLLQLSVLDTMCADLITTLTGERDAQLFLEELERDSMFLVPLDNHRSWYRFHHLFRQLLRYRLQAEHPGVEVELLKSSAAWHLERDQVRPAVEYLLQARDWSGALEVIGDQGSVVYERREMATVLRWIGQIPASAQQDRRNVDLLLAYLQAGEGLAAASKDTVRRINADPGASLGERTYAQAVLSALVQWLDHPAQSVAEAELAISMLAQVDASEIPFVLGLSDIHSLETLATISGGRGHFLNGALAEARDWLDRGLATVGATYSIWRVNGLGSLALVEAWCGNLGRADMLVNEALTLANDTGRLSHPSTADAHLARALCSLERGEPTGAALSLHEGTLTSEANHRTQLIWVSRLERAEIHAACGNFHEARATVRESRNEMGTPPPVVADRLVALSARMLRLEHAPAKAMDLLSSSTAGAGPATAFERIAAALATGQVELARKLIEQDPPVDRDVVVEHNLREVEQMVLRSWIAEAQGEIDQAQNYLAAAMSKAEMQGLVEVFIRGGSEVLRLVSHNSVGPSEFRQVVLDRARQAAAPIPGADLVDPLTDRELEILSLMPTRLTNAELAERCYVSSNTIKTHMAHIYRKLDVANRNGAVERGRELGLL